MFLTLVSKYRLDCTYCVLVDLLLQTYAAAKWRPAARIMRTFFEIFIVTVATLAFIGWLADRRADTKRSDVTPGLSLLPGDIKYESPNGNVKVYFPIMTSIVVSVLLTLMLRLFG
jgi:hypothetical protein